jgi:DNA/RNA-binding domain of Phe-tRNA-synthetase-like protein
MEPVDPAGRDGGEWDVAERAEWRAELPGWDLAWFEVEPAGGAGADAALAARRARAARTLAARYTAATLGEHPAVAALRRLFRQAGCDPSRYRPSSEALARRLLKGEELPPIHPLVDLNNALSVELLVPACVLAAGSFAFPVTLRAGRPGEVLDSMRGPLDLAGKPLLADAEGPFGTPITDAHRVKVRPGTARAWLVAYLPVGVVGSPEAERTLAAILAEAPVARRRD